MSESHRASSASGSTRMNRKSRTRSFPPSLSLHFYVILSSLFFLLFFFSSSFSLLIILASEYPNAKEIHFASGSRPASSSRDIDVVPAGTHVEQSRGSARRQKRNRLIKMLIARLVRRPPAMTARSSSGVASRGVREYLPLNPRLFSLLSSPPSSLVLLFLFFFSISSSTDYLYRPMSARIPAAHVESGLCSVSFSRACAFVLRFLDRREPTAVVMRPALWCNPVTLARNLRSADS